MNKKTIITALLALVAMAGQGAKPRYRTLASEIQEQFCDRIHKLVGFFS